ncbi:hypothetical protein HOG21_08385 [bacterium]|jgi:hypothetical protein|nr:hypothetical protein [bacterium]
MTSFFQDNHTAVIAAVASLYHLQTIFSIPFGDHDIYQGTIATFQLINIESTLFEILLLNFEYNSESVFFFSTSSNTHSKFTTSASSQSSHKLFITIACTFADNSSQNHNIDKLQVFVLIE